MGAPSMLCVLSSPPALEAPAVQVGGGVFGLLPAATLRATLPVVDGTALLVRYDTAAGMAHDVGLAARHDFGALRFELDVAHGFFGLEEIAGIHLDDAPFGNGLTTTLTALGGIETSGGHRVGLGGGLTARWTRLASDFGVVERRFDPSLHHLHGEARVDWTNGVFLRVRAVVPIEAELRVIGFWPQVLVGHTWSL